MSASPLSTCAGYYMISEIEKQNACEKAGRMGDRLTEGLKKSVARHNLPFVVFNQGSICHLDSVGTMHFAINWKNLWEVPRFLKHT